LNRRGYSTGKGKRWNQIRVATARRNHSIAGQKRALCQRRTKNASFGRSKNASMTNASEPPCGAGLHSGRVV
jgi:hypothetical protein